MKELEQAVANGYSVKILYHKSGEKQLNYRSVDPYRIIYWNNKWYVIGFCHLRNDIRSFKVDRIESLIQTENKFNRQTIFQQVIFYKSLLPTIEDKESIISLVINGDKMYWLIFANIGFRTLFTRTDFKSSSFSS